MVRFIHKVTGGDMWVHEDRVDEYKAAGHKPAAPCPTRTPEKKTRTAAKTKK